VANASDTCLQRKNRLLSLLCHRFKSNFSKLEFIGSLDSGSCRLLCNQLDSLKAADLGWVVEVGDVLEGQEVLDLLADALSFLFLSLAFGHLLNLLYLIFVDIVLFNKLRLGQPLTLSFMEATLATEETEEECLGLILEFNLDNVGDLVIILLYLGQGGSYGDEVCGH